jgi:hypothetical protein
VAYLEARLAQPESNLHLIRRVKNTRGSVRGSVLHQSLLWGLANTSHFVFVEMDGDLSHRPEELLEGAGQIMRDECDVAVFSFAVGAVISPRIHNYSNGYRLYSRATAEVIAEHEIRYASPIYLTDLPHRSAGPVAAPGSAHSRVPKPRTLPYPCCHCSHFRQDNTPKAVTGSSTVYTLL